MPEWEKQAVPDVRGFLLPDEKRALLRRFAPVLILFPEDRHLAPYPEEGDAIYTVRGSYHPRAVELFLDLARVRYNWRALWRAPWLAFFPRSYTSEIEAIQTAITPQELDQAAALYKSDPHYVGLQGEAYRSAIRSRLTQERLGDRLHSLDLPLNRSKNLKHWKAYFDYLERLRPAAQRSVVYGRLMQGLVTLNAEVASTNETEQLPLSSFGPVDVSRTRIALQYWFHYYYDDWANRHEGDLESITLLLDLDEALIRRAQLVPEDELLAGATVLEAGYSSHEDGYRRRWGDVQQTAEGRPIVYVARGSSASYFEWRIEGYPASARVGLVEKIVTFPGMFFGARRFLGRRWDAQYFARFIARGPKNTDWVAADPRPDDRLQPEMDNILERSVLDECQGVRRVPKFDSSAGFDSATYYLETDDLFWVEMSQEYGVHWGEDSPFPGTQGPRGLQKSERNKKAAHIDQLVRLEVRIERALDAIEQALRQVSERKLAVTNAIPQLDQALRPLRPAALDADDALPRSVRSFVYTMWAWILRVHPEAWPGGPGLINRWRFARSLRPGIFSIFAWGGGFQPLLDRQDPLYHIKTLLARVRQTRYETQHPGSKWDNPFSWVRHTCIADSFYYGRQPKQSFAKSDLQLIDCEDVITSSNMKGSHPRSG
ncbi:MAG: hypothetical protein JXA10_09760 [Anaerolineae bacterium]|nr:hypothetical protein [Anaerolineae bacterium]